MSKSPDPVVAALDKLCHASDCLLSCFGDAGMRTMPENTLQAMRSRKRSAATC